MEKVIYDLRLNIKHAGCKQQIELKKGESNARVFRIELSDGTEPIKLNAIDHTAVIRGLKADHTIIYNTASINEGKAEYTLGVQDTAAVGTTWYEVQIIDSGHSDNEKKVLYTAQFKAVVSDEVVDEETITSSDSFNRLETIINNNQSWLEQAREDIDYRTLVYDSELVLTAASNTTPDKVHSDYYGTYLLTFTSPWFTRDCDFIEIKNESINNVCNVTVLDSNGKERQIGQIVASETQKVDLNVVNKLTYRIVVSGMGPYDADITKFKFYKYKYISAAIDDVNKKHKEDIDQVYAKHNTDFETIRQQVIKRVKFYSTVKKFIEEMLKMPSDTSLYTSIHVIRDSVTPILYVRYIDSEYNDFKYVSDESFYENLSVKDTGVKIGYYYIAAVSEPRTWNYDVLSKIVSVPYTKTEVRELLNAVNQFNVAIVNKLPEENIDSHTIYFVPKEDKDTSDDYDEYIYLNNKWEHIGNTVIDLSNYVTRQRKIAELSLEKDITASELQAKLKESDNYSSDVTQAWLERFDDDIKLSQKFKNAIKEETSGKVDKENGKSLIDDNEIERLKKVNNYDDTNIKKQFNDEIEKLKGTLIENTVSGTEINLTDSSDMNIQELHLFGRTEQKTTKGIQLLNLKDAKGGTDDGVTYTPNGDGSFKRTGTATGQAGNIWLKGYYYSDWENRTPIITLGVGKSYYIKDCAIFQGQTLILSSERGSVINVTEEKYPEGIKITGIRNTGFTLNKTYNEVIYPIIAESSTAVDWEEYTGGQPSPNPEYKQEIKSVVNPIVSVAGKNILMPSIPNYSSNATITIQDRVENKIKIKVNKLSTTNTTYIVVTIPITRMIKKIKPNTKYTIILKNPSNITHTFIGLADGGNRITNTVKLTDNRVVLTTISDINNYSTKSPLIFYLTGSAIENATIGFDDIAVYEGEYSNAEIEPYKPIQSVTINCNFDRIDDIQDELIVENDGSNKLIQRLVDLQNIQPVIQGLYTKDTKAANTDLVYFYVKKAPRALAKKYGTVKASSNKFRWASSNIWAIDEPYVFDVYSTENSDNVRVLFRIKKDDDIDEILKAGINIEYALEEQIVVEDYLSPEEAQEILELNTYKPTTTIWSDQNVDMEIKYIADPKSYIDNKFNELASAIVASASESE